MLFFATAAPEVERQRRSETLWRAQSLPLAFFWFILAYFQQSEEIKANTAALTTQRDEMERQVEAMADQTAALARTADTLIEHTRPYVICYIRTEGINIEAVLDDIGSRPAQHVYLTFDPPLQELSDTRFSQAPVEHQPFLAPGQQIVVLMTTGVSVFNNAGKDSDEVMLETRCSASYEDLDGRKYQESFVVAKRFIKRAIQQPPSLPRAVEEVGNKLKDIRDSIRKIQEQTRQ